MQKFKAKVEKEFGEAIKDEDNTGAPSGVDSPFVVSTRLIFKSAAGADEYEKAFSLLAATRREFASTYILTKVRGGEDPDAGPEYMEFIVFRSSAHFRQHRLTESEGTTEMKAAMDEHVALDKVSISALGAIDDQERAVLRRMGAHLFEHSAGYVSFGNEGTNPVPVISQFKCRTAANVEEYRKVFQTTAEKIQDFASTYLLTKDPSDPEGLSMSEVLIYRSPDAFVNHAQLDVIKDQLGPALAKYLMQDSVQVTVIAQPEGSAVEQTLAAVNAVYTDLQAGFMT